MRWRLIGCGSFCLGCVGFFGCGGGRFIFWFTHQVNAQVGDGFAVLKGEWVNFFGRDHNLLAFAFFLSVIDGAGIANDGVCFLIDRVQLAVDGGHLHIVSDHHIAQLRKDFVFRGFSMEERAGQQAGQSYQAVAHGEDYEREEVAGLPV